MADGLGNRVDVELIRVTVDFLLKANDRNFLSVASRGIPASNFQTDSMLLIFLFPFDFVAERVGY